MIIKSVKDDATVNGLISKFRETLAEKSADLSYKLEASVGYDFLGTDDDTAEACLKRADERLYFDKNK